MLCAVPTLPAHPRLQPTTWPSAKSGYEMMPGPVTVQMRTRVAQVVAPPVARENACSVRCPPSPHNPGASHATWPNAKSGQRRCRALRRMSVRSARSVAPIRFSFSARSACSGGRPLPKGAGYPWPTDLAASQQPTERGRLCTSTSTDRQNKPSTTNQPPPPLHEPQGVKRTTAMERRVP